MYLVHAWDARTSTENWSCAACMRGTDTPDVPRQRAQRCGFGPEDGGIPPEEREPWPPGPAFAIDGLEADVCPAWYYRNGNESAVASVFAAESAGIALGNRDAAALIEGVALLRQARKSWLEAMRERAPGPDPLG